MSLSSTYCILSILRTDGWEMGPHILPSSNILESEGLAQSQALGVGGLLRVWHEHVWPLGSVRAGKPPPSDQLKAPPPDLWCGFYPTPSMPTAFHTRGCEGLLVSLCCQIQEDGGVEIPAPSKLRAPSFYFFK